MKPKISVILLLIIFGLNCFTSVNFIETCKASDPPTLYVDDDNTAGPWEGNSIHPYRYIQSAINAASSGYRIQVLAGDYEENIIINKTSLDLFGEDKSLTTVTGSSSGDVITITATGVDISDLTITSSGSSLNNAAIKINASNSVIVNNIITSSANGFYIYNCSNTKIYYNTITSNSKNGIHIENSSYNNITHTTSTSSTFNGIFFYNSSNNTIGNCILTSNSRNGIYLNSTCNDNLIEYSYIASNTLNGIYFNDHCDNNNITYNSGTNKIHSNSDSGIRLENSSSNYIGNNIITSNTDYGIMVLGANNTIDNNTISSNSKHGVFLFGDYNNVVNYNHIQGNTKDGIRIQNSTSDTIHSNNITQNSQYGVYLNYYAISNSIYNNYFYNNSDHALDMSENNNIWSISTTGFNIVNGANSVVAGNYWDDYDNATEGAVDNDGNGVADSARTINISSSDSRPILDTSLPTIGTASASPYTQTQGGYTYISAGITDNTALEEVRLVVTDPNGQNSNISILGYRTGNTYYYNHQFSVVGIYSYRIDARDPRNWRSSSTRSFEIDEGTAPTITDNTPSTGSPGTRFTFNVTVVDDTDSTSDIVNYGEVKVNWVHGSSGSNESLTNILGTTYFVLTVSLESTTNNLTYTIYAEDQWDNSVTTSTATVTITDSTPPTITIVKRGSSFDNFPNSYTFGATVTDNIEVENVTIEYWYEGSDHLTVYMDEETTNYYEKVFVINENPSIVYCIIYATDISGNQNDTKTPFINASGPYTGIVGTEVTFNATNSFDLDGNITTYSWVFGDGTTGTGSTVDHTYSASGTYTVTLTITDNDGNTNTETVTALIISSTKLTASSTTITEVENEYSVTLDNSFYCYDIDGDSIVDTFIDPNNVLKAVHTGNINISGNITFLLSVNDSEVPDFIWNTTTDEIIDISHLTGTNSDITLDATDDTATMTVTINKTSGWIFLEVADPTSDDYTISNLLTVKLNNTEIDNYKIFRKTTKTYILDDPETIYEFTYSYSLPPLNIVSINPPNGGTINQNNPTITLTYNLPVTVDYANFYISNLTVELNIINDLETNDNIVFTYTPPNDLTDGLYILDIDVLDEHGTKLNQFISYQYQSYEVIEEGFPWMTLIMLFGAIGAAGAILFILSKKNIITFESFIYIKNRKIIPFFKPLIFGPLRIDVNDNKVKKAEFYVNGQLKDTLTQEPFIWNWDEPSFRKKLIETKIYDEEGNVSSSGEMKFYIFNTPKLFK
ncbi:MAG: right-handed parallel beta-helix repeat-containing protein [Thermoplasmatales archaeon]|nr:right-handed parallel beta-helix repeat-containing protein [Thermoplasmatales archaeon]